MISDLHKKGHYRELAELYKIVVKWVINLTMPFFLILSMFSKSILYVFGDEFSSGYLTLIILAFLYFSRAAMSLVARFLQMRGKQNIDLINAIVLVFVNIVLNIVLIPRFGVAGAALATCISSVLVNTIRLIQVYRIYGIFPYDRRLKKIIMPIGIAVIFGIAWVRLASFHWISLVLGPISMLISYFVVQFMQGFDQEDILILNALKMKISSLSFKTGVKK